jgi:hypothetical protein
MWHILALALGGRTIAEWQAIMSIAEFNRWIDYYRDYPYDDLHRYHRPAALISYSQSGGEISDKLAWLAPNPDYAGFDDADIRTMRAFGL